MAELPPGTIKIEYSLGPHGLAFKGDGISAVTSGTQSEVKGVKVGWKVRIIIIKVHDSQY
jgi:hypothetical protein